MSKKIYIFIILLPVFIVLGMYFLRIPAGNCGEEFLYRTKFGIYFCNEYGEGGGTECRKKYGGLNHYLGINEVNCKNK